jgi:hypothetical protein
LGTRYVSSCVPVSAIVAAISDRSCRLPTFSYVHTEGIARVGFF